MVVDVRLVFIHAPVLGPASVRPTADVLSARGWAVSIADVGDWYCASAPRWREFVRRAGRAVEDGGDRRCVLVGHSGAGLLLPAIAAQAEAVEGLVFVDAIFPPAEGVVPMAQGWFLRHVRETATDAMLPPWFDWWDSNAIEAALPEAATRAAIAADSPRLPLAFFEEEVSMPQRWRDHRLAYVQLSAVFDNDREVAEAAGATTRKLDATHLDLAGEPHKVAAAIADVVAGAP